MKYMSLTPEQFNILATKDDVKEAIIASEERMAKKIDKIVIELVATKENLKDFCTKTEMDEKFDQVLSATDAVMHKLDNIEHSFVSNQVAHDRTSETITNHEIRMKKLELKNV